MQARPILGGVGGKSRREMAMTREPALLITTVVTSPLLAPRCRVSVKVTFGRAIWEVAGHRQKGARDQGTADCPPKNPRAAHRRSGFLLDIADQASVFELYLRCIRRTPLHVTSQQHSSLRRATMGWNEFGPKCIPKILSGSMAYCQSFNACLYT